MPPRDIGRGTGSLHYYLRTSINSYNGIRDTNRAGIYCNIAKNAAIFAMYTLRGDSILEDMVVPTDMLRCENVHCNNRTHKEYIDKMCSDIINACLQASDDAIPQTD